MSGAAGKISLVITDLDGTILRPDGSFSEATRQAFWHLKAAGIPAAFATARFHTRELAQKLGVSYMIRTDGTLISDAAGRVLHCWDFSEEETDGMLREIYRKNPHADIAVPTLEEVCRGCRPPFHKKALKIVATLQKEGDALEIAEAFGCRAVRYRGEDRYSFLPAGAGKEEAVRALAKLLKIPLSRAAASRILCAGPVRRMGWQNGWRLIFPESPSMWYHKRRNQSIEEEKDDENQFTGAHRDPGRDGQGAGGRL